MVSGTDLDACQFYFENPAVASFPSAILNHGPEMQNDCLFEQRIAVERPMNKLTMREASTYDRISVVCISPFEEDHVTLGRILDAPEPALHAEWVIYRKPTLNEALSRLRTAEVPIVLCDTELLAGTWKEILEELGRLPKPPVFIVTSRLADERLWAEALNLGAYDVLAKPFDAEEVTRVLTLAWLRRKHEPQTRNRTAARTISAQA